MVSIVGTTRVEDHAFSSSAMPFLLEIAPFSTKGTHVQHPTSRRRPRPGNLVRAAVPLAEAHWFPCPPQGQIRGTGRPSSVPATPRSSNCIGKDALAIAPCAGASMLDDIDSMDAEKLRFAFRDVWRRYEMQALQLLELQQEIQTSRTASGTTTRNTTCTQWVDTVAQACQTDERAFTDQFDAILRESALKTKQLRKLKEVSQSLRAELHQEKLMADQFRSQVEDLEQQLGAAIQKQHRAEAERALADCQLRHGSSSRHSRSSTPQPRMEHAKTAWLERGTKCASTQRSQKIVGHAGDKFASTPGRSQAMNEDGGLSILARPFQAGENTDIGQCSATESQSDASDGHD